MSLSVPVQVSKNRRTQLRRAIFAVDLLLLLSPPAHWLFSSGQSSIWYFLVANALVTLSLFALWKTSAAEGEDAS